MPPPLARDNGPHVPNSNDEVGNGLEEKVHIEVVLPIQKIIACAEEEESRKSQLHGIDSVHSKPHKQ